MNFLLMWDYNSSWCSYRSCSPCSSTHSHPHLGLKAHSLLAWMQYARHNGWLTLLFLRSHSQWNRLHSNSSFFPVSLYLFSQGDTSMPTQGLSVEVDGPMWTFLKHWIRSLSLWCWCPVLARSFHSDTHPSRNSTLNCAFIFLKSTQKGFVCSKQNVMMTDHTCSVPYFHSPLCKQHVKIRSWCKLGKCHTALWASLTLICLSLGQHSPGRKKKSGDNHV